MILDFGVYNFLDINLINPTCPAIFTLTPGLPKSVIESR